MAIFAEVTENECIERHLRIIDASLICVGAFSTSESHSYIYAVDMIAMGLLKHYMACPSDPSVCHTCESCDVIHA